MKYHASIDDFYVLLLLNFCLSFIGKNILKDLVYITLIAYLLLFVYYSNLFVQSRIRFVMVNILHDKIDVISCCCLIISTSQAVD